MVLQFFFSNIKMFFCSDVGRMQFDPFGMQPKTKLPQKSSVHIQDDGTIYAICATGTSTKDSLLSWIRLLERDGNSVLGTIPVLFKFKSPVDSQMVVAAKKA